MGSSDPTDHALAAIASIRDGEGEASQDSQSEAEKQAIAVSRGQPLAPEQPDGDGYFKVARGRWLRSLQMDGAARR